MNFGTKILKKFKIIENLNIGKFYSRSSMIYKIKLVNLVSNIGPVKSNLGIEITKVVLSTILISIAFGKQRMAIVESQQILSMFTYSCDTQARHYIQVCPWIGLLIRKGQFSYLSHNTIQYILEAILCVLSLRKGAKVDEIGAWIVLPVSLIRLCNLI